MRADDHPYFDTGGPVGLAHRGGAAYPPNLGRENTIAAFKSAVDLGFRYLETDVHATSDGLLIAFHDDELDRVTDAGGLIAQLPYAEVRQARTAAGDGIPLLDEVLDSFPDTRLNIDVKSGSAIEPLVSIIKRHNAIGRVCIASFSDRRLAAVRRALGPGLATAMGPRRLAAMRFTPALINRLLRSDAPVLQIPTTHVVKGRTVRLLTPGLLRRAHALGKHVHIWTVDDPARMAALLDAGVDGIVTDRPDVLAKVFADRGLTP